MNMSAARSFVNSVLCFDLGGTSARAGYLVGGHGPALAHLSANSERIRTARDPARAIMELLGSLADALGAHAPANVVLAIPGPVTGGRVSRLPTLIGPKTIDFDLVALASRRWPDSSIWICNDLTAAGYGCVARGYRDFMVVTCGSGIGAKLFVAGSPLLGRDGGGGEIGHWRVAGLPPLPCECGGKGHLGAIASGRGAENLFRWLAQTDSAGFSRSLLAHETRAGHISSRSIVQAYAAGDAWTAQGLALAAAALGQAFALVHLASGVERFFITGGFAAALGLPFIAEIANAAAASSWPTSMDWPSAITLAPDPDSIALVGGAYLSAHLPPDLRCGRSDEN